MLKCATKVIAAVGIGLAAVLGAAAPAAANPLQGLPAVNTLGGPGNSSLGGLPGGDLTAGLTGGLTGNLTGGLGG